MSVIIPLLGSARVPIVHYSGIICDAQGGLCTVYVCPVCDDLILTRV